MAEEKKSKGWLARQADKFRGKTLPAPPKPEDDAHIAAPVAGGINISAAKPKKPGDAKPAVVEIAQNPLEDNGLSMGERLGDSLKKLKTGAASVGKKVRDANQERKDTKQADKDAAQAVKDTRQEYLKAIVNGFGDKNIAQAPIEAFVKGNGLAKLIELTDITSTEAGKTVFTAKDKINAYSFTLDETGVTHNDTDTTVTKEEALLTAELINLNASAHENGVEITGTDEEKAAYYFGMLEKAPDVLINNKKEIMNIDPAILKAAEDHFKSAPKAGGAGMDGGGPTGGTAPK